MAYCGLLITGLETNGVLTSPLIDCPDSVGNGREGYRYACDGDSYSFTCPEGYNLLEGNEVVDSPFVVPCETDDTVNLPPPDLTCMEGSGMMGEPHIKKWNGEWYDWQGECDAVFLHAPDFMDGLGLDIHTRTTIRYQYSFIETVAVRIGADILEVSSFGDFALNGIGLPDLPQVMGDCCNVTHTQMDEKQHAFFVDMGKGAKLELSTHKDIVSIKMLHQDSPTTEDWFGKSSGLMGTFEGGKTLARDGMTVLEDPNELGQEWQVLDSDPTLFTAQRAPQFPEKCRLPNKDAAAEKRRLLGGGISQEEAAKACAHWKEDEKEMCIADVMATNDLELATESNGY